MSTRAERAAIRLDHAEILEAMATLYRLLGQLQIVPSEKIIIPTEDNPAPIKRDEAFNAGFSTEAVNFMEQLPFVNTASDPDIHPRKRRSPTIKPFTQLVNWTDVYEWGGFEELVEGDWVHQILENNVIYVRLTVQIIYGTEWIYDVDYRLIEVYKHKRDVVTFRPGRPPSDVINPMIQKWRSLELIVTPNLGVQADNVFSGPEERDDDDNSDGYHGDGDHGDGDHSDGDHSSEDANYTVTTIPRVSQAREERARNAYCLAMWGGIRDLYLKCGWDVASETQDAFDADRFAAMRQRYANEMTLPLFDMCHLIREESLR